MTDGAHHASPAFAPTRWSLVLAARGADRSVARVAIGELCRLYWYPLYGFARRKGFSPPDAEDATQAFFLHLVESNLLSSPDPARGRLRSFLLTAFQHDLEDARRASRREKRGGGVEMLHLDTTGAESLYQLEPADPATPEAHFERQWARAVLAGCLEHLREQYTATGRAGAFEALRPFLNPDDPSGASYEAAAEALQLTPAAVRQAVHRLRERFAELLRSHIADTLEDPTPAAIDAELLALRAALQT